MNWIAGYKQHYKALIFLGLPIVIGQVGVIILGFADTLMIGHHSTEELGAASFVNNVFTLCIIFSTGFSYGLTPIVGSLYGNRRFAEAGQALRCSLVANVLVALLLTFIMTVVYFNVERLGQPEELMPLIKPYYLVFKKLNALGWPVGLQMGMETASFSLSAIMVGWLGTIALASHQIMLTISQFTFMMYYGMGAAVAVRVSNFKGQDDMENVRRSTFAGFHLIMAMEVVLMSIVFVMRGQVGGWFTDSAEASALVASLFFPFLIYQFGDGLQINFANALRGISDVKPMMVIAFISYFIISLPVGYFCGFVLGWGLVGVWMAFPFGLTSAGVMLWLRFRYKTRTR